MCGLVGVVGSVSKREKGIFQSLFLTNVLRGPHGCGMILGWEEHKYDKKTKKSEWENYYQWTTSELPSSEYIFKDDFADLMSQGNMKFIAGHSRWATKGKVTKENNHPFTDKKGKLVGMHNGTINGTFTGTDKYDTDSEALFNLIAQKGLYDALAEVYTSSFNPAWALVYFDIKKGEINFIRNKERPLYFCWNLKDLYWASEKVMLVHALGRVGVKDPQIFEAKEDALYTINPYDVNSDLSCTEDFIKRVDHPCRFQPVNQNYGVVRESNLGKKDQNPYPKNSHKGPLYEPYVKIGFNNWQILSVAQYHLSKNSCAVCDKNFNKDDLFNVYYNIRNQDEVYCDECYDILPTIGVQHFQVDKVKQEVFHEYN